VRGQVSIGHFQHLFQVIKIHLFVYNEYAHHTQPNAIIKNFI
jgi:hypothetical protein